MLKRDDTYVEPPHNIEAEQALLGGILVNNDAIAHLPAFLQGQHFYESLHGRIFERIVTMFRAGQVASPVTMKHLFEEDEDLKEIGGPVYLARLAAAATTILNVPEYGRVVYHLAIRRNLMDYADDIQREAQSFPLDADMNEWLGGVVDALGDHLQKLRRERQTKHLLAKAAGEAIEEAKHYQDAPTGVNLGFQRLDDLIGGFRKGEFYVLGGRPGMGKSALGIAISLNAAFAGHGVYYASGEMPAAAISQRCLTDVAYQFEHPITYQALRNGTVSPAQWERIEQAEETFKAAPLVIDDQTRMTPAELTAAARQTARYFEREGRTLDLIVIDHLHKLEGNARLSMVERTAHISGALADLSKILQVPVLCLVQLNREVEKRDDKRPSLADLRWAGEIEQDADAVMFVYRPAYYLERQKYSTIARENDRRAELDVEKHKIEAIVAKQRHGPIATIELWCDIACNAIRDEPPEMPQMDMTL